MILTYGLSERISSFSRFHWSGGQGSLRQFTLGLQCHFSIMNINVDVIIITSSGSGWRGCLQPQGIFRGHAIIFAITWTTVWRVISLQWWTLLKILVINFWSFLFRQFKWSHQDMIDVGSRLRLMLIGGANLGNLGSSQWGRVFRWLATVIGRTVIFDTTIGEKQNI